MKKKSLLPMLITVLLLLPVMLICTNPVTIQGDNQGKHDTFAATQPNTTSSAFTNEVNTDEIDMFSGPAELCLTAYPFEVCAVYAPDCPAPAMLVDPIPIPPEGTGSPEDPYLIAGLENLYWISVETNAGNTFSGKFFLQTADIDATETETWFNGLGWEPIGSESNPFSGFYDGGNNAIESLYINMENENNLGLFGFMDGANIEKLQLPNANITGYSMVGALAGKVVNQTNISYVEVENAQIYISGSYAGCVVGGASYSNIFRCSSSGKVTKGDAYVANWIGGIAGAINYFTMVEECYSLADIRSLTNNNYAGLIGIIWLGGQAKNCYARGDAIGTWAISGGFTSHIENGLVSNCYSTGRVEGDHLYGGFCGRIYNGGLCYDNFWDIETSMQTTSACATGKTTTEMKTQSTFTNAGWDFDNVWTMDGVTNDGYPFLKWQAGPQSVNDISALGLLIYPNPGDGTFTIEGTHEKINLRIFNAFGVEVYMREMNLPEKVDISTQPKGIYFIRVEMDSSLFFEKLVIN